MLTPTKAHDQFMPALAEILTSLKKYMHGDVELVFTDNIHANKPELERVFPLLTYNVSSASPKVSKAGQSLASTDQ